jgi:integrase
MFSLSKSEIRQVLEVIDLDSPFGRRDYLLILFLFHTGLRVGECSGRRMCPR